MPLGQAPYGSRQTPRDEEPPEDPDQRGNRPAMPGRWLLFASAAVLLAFMLARGGRSAADRKAAAGVAGPSPCLTNRSCAEHWYCYVVPKDDPFAVEGECSQVCESDLQCPAKYRCEKVAVGEKGPLVVPIGARGATAETTGVCRACGPDGCAPQ